MIQRAPQISLFLGGHETQVNYSSPRVRERSLWPPNKNTHKP